MRLPATGFAWPALKDVRGAAVIKARAFGVTPGKGGS